MNSNQRWFTIGVTLVLLVYPCVELFALMFTRAVRSEVAPPLDPTVVTWGSLIAVAISFALAVSQYAHQKQFTQGLTNKLSGSTLALWPPASVCSSKTWPRTTSPSTSVLPSSRHGWIPTRYCWPPCCSSPCT
ncbi:hypothetical protein CCYS_03875 [Corynebacterium cystitidis DSM 20524]|uniref:Uncharacterized protein n=1 Tax=Corynebacterium cystitidis DSM 20524 TaxID=1121357 RepID=A0A1H9QMP9_9CORY|nr:hypothetical protein CCYS_03875 [Corynebacterium cystitidis DSM 20524]SER61129.1 hypothetical protein SAMN05661109_00591 [Corynebacterium cystitidis DSM 20524]SNV84265.1 Uncharacterised protein [Corynebacterium cystitidis]